MAKKEPEFVTYSFTNEYGVPIFSARMALSKQTLKNYVEEFKYKYDLKKLEISHVEYFMDYLTNAGVKIDKVVSIEWK